jgi:hypothetical protein
VGQGWFTVSSRLLSTVLLQHVGQYPSFEGLWSTSWGHQLLVYGNSCVHQQLCCCRSPGAYSRKSSSGLSSVGFNVNIDAPDAGDYLQHGLGCSVGFSAVYRTPPGSSLQR